MRLSPVIGLSIAALTIQAQSASLPGPPSPQMPAGWPESVSCAVEGEYQRLGASWSRVDGSQWGQDAAPRLEVTLGIQPVAGPSVDFVIEIRRKADALIAVDGSGVVLGRAKLVDGDCADGLRKKSFPTEGLAEGVSISMITSVEAARSLTGQLIIHLNRTTTRRNFFFMKKKIQVERWLIYESAKGRGLESNR
jgi:hypothetical protein